MMIMSTSVGPHRSCRSLLLGLVVLVQLSATHRIMMNQRTQSHRRITMQTPAIIRETQKHQDVASKKMQVMLGMCQEDREIELKNIPKTFPLANTIPNPTPEEIAENTITDMVDVMTKVKEKEGNRDPVMNNLMEKMKEMTATMEVNTGIGTHRPGETAQDFEERIKELLSISGIEALLPLDCGRNPRSPMDPLDAELLPWVAALGSSEDGRFHYRCTGALITNQHILTDADCAASANINIVQLNVTKALPEPFAVENYVVGRRIHPSIRGPTDFLNGSNIGLLELAMPVFFNDYIQPICLPGVFDTPDPLALGEGTIVGFNSIIDTPQGRLASLNILRNSRVLGSSICFTAIRLVNERFPDQESTLYTLLTEDHICADRIFESVGKSILLQEDSTTNRVKLVGVGGIANALRSNPIAYTLVQKHRFWVELVLKKFMDNTSERRT
ncbi:Serine protease hepsin-like [Homarus americanus]|uniref:Serine protease hepsin-like n=2 Tax=Homarus americanus TaxID=6706 RepID=A0A8J5MKR4_HOMAM|nr:Serine protease hepsin-like [Homarus americanus]